MLIDMLHTEFIIVGALGTGSSVLAEVTNLKPDIILLDIDLGDITGFAVAEHLRCAGCPAKVVFLSVHGVLLSFTQLEMLARSATS